jgi:hypothetical protein
MINKDTKNLTTEDATSYLAGEIPKNFQNVNLRLLSDETHGGWTHSVLRLQIH